MAVSSDFGVVVGGCEARMTMLGGLGTATQRKFGLKFGALSFVISMPAKLCMSIAF